jgi:hypothetical protein
MWAAFAGLPLPDLPDAQALTDNPLQTASRGLLGG